MRIVIEDPRYPDRVTHPTGYAEVHRQLVLALDRIGADVYFPECTESIRSAATLTESMRRDLLRLNTRRSPNDRDTVYLQISSPDCFEPRPGRFNVGFTMTERESLATYQNRIDWTGRCNAMDLILTPSEWNRGVFHRHGIPKVRVVPLGIDYESFSPRPVKFFSVLRGYGYEGSRANWQDIVDSFVQEFKDTRDVQLTIFTQEPRQPFRYDGLRDTLRHFPLDVAGRLRAAFADNCPEVIVREGGNLDREELRNLYIEHDCYVSYSREGWGFPALEAMSCGLEVISCDFGAPMEYLAGSPARLFDAGHIRPDNLQLEGGDLATLRRHLREVYAARRVTSRWARRFGWDRAATRLVEVLRAGHDEWLRTGSVEADPTSPVEP